MRAGRLTQQQTQHIERVTGKKIMVALKPEYDTSGRTPVKIHRIKFRGEKRFVKVRER